MRSGEGKIRPSSDRGIAHQNESAGARIPWMLSGEVELLCDANVGRTSKLRQGSRPNAGRGGSIVEQGARHRKVLGSVGQQIGQVDEGHSRARDRQHPQRPSCSWLPWRLEGDRAGDGDDQYPGGIDLHGNSGNGSQGQGQPE